MFSPMNSEVRGIGLVSKGVQDCRGAAPHAEARKAVPDTTDFIGISHDASLHECRFYEGPRHALLTADGTLNPKEQLISDSRGTYQGRFVVLRGRSPKNNAASSLPPGVFEAALSFSERRVHPAGRTRRLQTLLCYNADTHIASPKSFLKLSESGGRAEWSPLLHKGTKLRIVETPVFGKVSSFAYCTPCLSSPESPCPVVREARERQIGRAPHGCRASCPATAERCVLSFLP
jgi:hypothetical protein